ncbi:GGDEF domain-containing protein [Methylotenera sp.]|uniref:GGDEF domain-containing protein n=1 Tax=Methylotenera sp. TaxID=2051956 RepID=UPI0027259FCA|nr:GGDEF domain-containing protein [Methylotenera sp.]MDO9204362.1 GGDEF domain-containing protein [Methylotenera sp.]MDP1522555.1 GGDEF domain-containing protein [Methylotenera sp.]MDP2071330.1 GGDEF domain-containing protein [Methylotenera sp.]MDP3006380.1 GGDEF domain-containing protein [Methylotenera sp.]MDP3819264.1 GGDEF domain-containing protein [Methylotenera sp.]
MHTANTHLILDKLIALTYERDVVAIELLLAQTLFDLIAPYNAEGDKSVSVYRVEDVRKQLPPDIVIGKPLKKDALSPRLTQKLIEIFKSGGYSTYAQEGEPSAALYPLKNAAGHTVAIIGIENFVCDPQSHENFTKLLQIYQNFTGLINDNERDTLTGLLNRKTFEKKINKVLARMRLTNARKEDEAKLFHYLAIFDIDHFKRVNDEFGHLIGDEVLLLFSQLMTQTFRTTDPLFRFGGEEFVGVFECTSQSDIPIILERFREKVGNFNFPQVGKVTVSAGYTEILADDASSQLIDRADLALYFAKNNGRNRICHYEQLVDEGAIQENKKEGDIELF